MCVYNPNLCIIYICVNNSERMDQADCKGSRRIENDGDLTPSPCRNYEPESGEQQLELGYTFFSAGFLEKREGTTLLAQMDM